MIILKLNESSATLRVVPLPPLLQNSATTSYCTNESGRTFEFSLGGVYYGSGGSISAVSAAAGDYACLFSASKISVTGIGAVHYGGAGSSTTALRVSVPIMVVPIDSFDSMRLGLFALPNAAAEAAGGLPTLGTGTGQISVSNGSVGIKAQTHSGVTIKGIENYANISSVTLNAGTHSGATIQGVTRVNSSVTPADATYSAVTVRIEGVDYSGLTIKGVTNYANFPLTSVATSIWSATRSAFTTPGSFGEYVYSQVTGTSSGTVQGVTRALNLSANGDKTGYSISGTKTTLDALNDIDGSGVTLHAGVHSAATIQGVTRVNSNVTPANGLYSAVTVRFDLVDYSGATVGVNNIAPGLYSGVSVEVKAGGIQAGSLGAGTITAAKFGAGAIDAAALATDAGQEIADALLGRNIAGGSDGVRTVSEALYPLRNRSLIQGSVGTVYGTDDSTSAWTFSPSLGTAPIAGIDPTT